MGQRERMRATMPSTDDRQAEAMVQAFTGLGRDLLSSSWNVLLMARMVAGTAF
jgi:hypothetical protein